MEDFPEDEDLFAFPISPESSALDALCSLNPPSPVLTPSQFVFTLSSGDIPFLLYDDGYTQGDSISQLSISDYDKRRSVTTIDTKHASFRQSLGPSVEGHHQRASPTSCDGYGPGMVASESAATIRSAGTFGPMRQSYGTEDLKRLSSANGRSAGELSPSSPFVVGPPTSPSGETPFNMLSRGSRRTSAHTNSALNVPHTPDRRLNPEEWYSAPSGSAGNISARESALVEPSSSTVDTSFGTETTTTFANASPQSRLSKAVSWISSSDWDNQQYKDFIAKSNSISSPTASPGNLDEELIPEPRRRSRISASHSPGKILQDRKSQAFPSPQQRSSHVSPKSGRAHQHDNHASGTQNSPRHDTDHSWLKDVTVHFFIDQEGFRDAEPCFKFSGISRLRSFQDSKSPDTVMAQFRPMARQSFHFHHAPFEGPPVLRRITANNDETHDYVSKQAYLTLKNNGVYVVHGHEMLASVHESEQVKLRWQFEYLVDDRRGEVSGSSHRNLEGEKTLTPLTFSCSPKLMMATQAKRINIMHVLKKGVAPKLVAEKLQPPAARPTARAPTRPPNSPAGPEDMEHSKGQGWSFHRRTRSHGIKNNDSPTHRAVSDHIYPSGSRTLSKNNDGAPSESDQKQNKHRRASSADDHHPSRLSNARHSISALASRRRPADPGPSVAVSQTSPSPRPQPSRHILPPAQLAELLDSPVKENKLPVTPDRASRRSSGTTTPTSDRGSKGFGPLSPRPKNSHISRVR